MVEERRVFWEMARSAKRAVAVTGAGVSAESGVPTFRGDGGLWRTYRPEELATPEAFARDPRLVWEWYDWRRGLIAQARPNAAHDWLAAYERRNPAFLLATQNVDGLHAMAGSRRVREVHGSLWRLRCVGCGIEREDRRVPLASVPRCEECGAVLRPGVVWFGESLPPRVWEETAEAVSRCDLLMILGTSSVVYPVAGLSRLAPRGATVVEVNPEETALSPQATFSVRAPVGAFLGEILEALRVP